MRIQIIIIALCLGLTSCAQGVQLTTTSPSKTVTLASQTTVDSLKNTIAALQKSNKLLNDTLATINTNVLTLYRQNRSLLADFDSLYNVVFSGFKVIKGNKMLSVVNGLEEMTDAKRSAIKAPTANQLVATESGVWGYSPVTKKWKQIL